MAKTYKNFINGQWVAPSTGKYFENRNPANTSDLIGRFPDSGAKDVADAVRSAKRGFEIWRKTPASEQTCRRIMPTSWPASPR